MLKDAGSPLLALIAVMLTGCAGSVIFGHVVGESHPTATPTPRAMPTASASAPATATAVAPSTTMPVQQATDATGPPPESTATPPPLQTQVAAGKFGAASVVITSSAKEKIEADPRFNREALSKTIDAELRSQHLLDDGADTTADRTLEIVIDDFSHTAASNAVVFGYVVSNATLGGSAVVHDATGREVSRFEIKTDARLMTPAQGEQAQPLSSLYKNFADVTVHKLTGVPMKKEPTELPR